MKRVFVAVLLVTALCVVASAAFAEQQQGKMMEKTMMQEGKMGCGGMSSAKGMMGKMRMGSMGCGMMMNSMMIRSLVATEDGGVVVSVGNKLKKYDKNLKLVKEVEIQVDMEAMNKMMMQMKEKCPMMMQHEGGMMEGAEEEMEPASKPKSN
jgi:hypothetical protein